MGGYGAGVRCWHSAVHMSGNENVSRDGRVVRASDACGELKERGVLVWNGHVPSPTAGLPPQATMVLLDSMHQNPLRRANRVVAGERVKSAATCE